MTKGLRALAVAVVGLGGLAACSSNPSARTVALDVVDAVPNLTDGQRNCLRQKLDGYTDEELSAIAAGNESLTYGSAFDIERASDDFQTFVADLEECRQSN